MPPEGTAKNSKFIVGKCIGGVKSKFVFLLPQKPPEAYGYGQTCLLRPVVAKGFRRIINIDSSDGKNYRIRRGRIYNASEEQGCCTKKRSQARVDNPN